MFMFIDWLCFYFYVFVLIHLVLITFTVYKWSTFISIKHSKYIFDFSSALVNETKESVIQQLHTDTVHIPLRERKGREEKTVRPQEVGLSLGFEAYGGDVGWEHN